MLVMKLYELFFKCLDLNPTCTFHAEGSRSKASSPALSSSWLQTNYQRQTSDIPRSQTQLVNEYIHKNIKPTAVNTIKPSTILPITYKQTQSDWMKYIRILSTPVDAELSNGNVYSTNNSTSVPKTTRPVVTGNPKKKVSKLHVGYTMNSAHAQKPFSKIGRFEYTTLAC